jgi:hypothetical protein
VTDQQKPQVVLGVIAAPGQAADVAQQVIGEGLASAIAERLPAASWQVDIVESQLVRPPADDADLIDAARDVLLRRDWDMVVCLTDLPLHARKRPVVAHANPMHGVAVISVPALGAVGRRHRVRDMTIELVEQLLGRRPDDSDEDVSQRLRELGTDVEAEPAAFTARVLTGNLRLLTGMVRANQPWRLTLRLSRALAAAAAAGVFALITSDIWRLADTFGAARMVGANVGSIVAIAATLIIGAGLWERRAGRGLREQVVLFNIATTATVVLGVAAFYVALLLLAGLAAAFLVVPAGFSEAVGHPVSVSDYAELAWLTCSLATVGGALGAGLETDDVVREAAYAQHSGEGPDPDLV